MLRSVNKTYIIFGTFIYGLVAALFPIEFEALYALNYFTLLAFALIIGYLLKQPADYFTRKKMAFIVFYYTLFFVFSYNLISYFYTGNFYLFSEGDAILYHNEAEVMSNMPFLKSIDYYLSRHESEDLGIALILSILYKIAPTKLLLSVAYIFVAIITANSMYNISKRFMPVKYACLCVLTYCLSSYVIWFHSSGLKESFLILLIVLFYSNYYNFIFDKKITGIWGLVLSAVLILFFRPVLSLFCLASVAISVVLKRKLTLPQLFFLFAIMFAGIYFLDVIMSSTDKFLLGGTESMLEIKEMEGMIKGSVSFTYLVNTLSSMFGPFATLASDKPHLCFYAPGLIFKIFLSVAFWFGVIYVYTAKMYKVYPILVFILLEVISLTYILEALELRKSVPHFPLIYIIAFIFISKFDSRQLADLKTHLFYKKSFNVLVFVLCLLIVYWNFR